MLLKITKQLPNLGDRIKERRHELGISMLDFAQGIGKSKSYVTNLEKNELTFIDYKMIQKIESFLNIELIEIELKINMLF